MNFKGFKCQKRLAFFTKDEIDWSGPSLETFYETLLSLKRNNDAMSAEIQSKRVKTSADASVLTYVRESDKNKVVIMINMSNQPQTVSTKDEVIAGKSYEIFSKIKETITLEKPIMLKPWDYKIFVYKAQ